LPEICQKPWLEDGRPFGVSSDCSLSGVEAAIANSVRLGILYKIRNCSNAESDTVGEVTWGSHGVTADMQCIALRKTEMPGRGQLRNHVRGSAVSRFGLHRTNFKYFTFTTPDASVLPVWKRPGIFPRSPVRQKVCSCAFEAAPPPLLRMPLYSGRRVLGLLVSDALCHSVRPGEEPAAYPLLEGED
jgi:hypothetical protein